MQSSIRAAATPHATPWGLVLLLWGAGLGVAGQYGKLSVIFDRLPAIYPQAGASLGFAVSLVGMVGIVLGVAAGVIVARAGYRRSILVALGVGAAMSAFQASFPPLPLFLASRVVEGASHLAVVVAAPTLIAQLSAPADRGLTLTLWGSFFGVAFAILAWAGLPLADAWGAGALLFGHALYLLAMLAVLWRWLPALNAAPRPDAPGLGDLLAAHRRIYASPAMSAPAIGWVFYTACFVSLLTVLPPFLPAGSRALVAGAIPLIAIASSLTLGVALLRYLPAVQVVTLGFLSAAACAAAMWLLPGHLLPPLALGAALGLIQGSTFAAVPQLNAGPADQALANGGMAQSGNLGNTTGTPIMVAVISVAGFGGLTMALTALLLLGALLIWLRAPRHDGGF